MPRKQEPSFWSQLGAVGGVLEALFGNGAMTQRRRAVKESRLLLREARRALKRYAHRLTEAQTATVRGAIDGLSAALVERDFDKLPAALNALDDAMDAHLGFARKSTAREYAESIGVAVLIALFLRAFVVEAFKIPSGSMIPTLQVGDHIFVNKFIYGPASPIWQKLFPLRDIRRDDIIVLRYPVQPDTDFVKRVIGMPGDVVEIRDKKVSINGKKLDEPYVINLDAQVFPLQPMLPEPYRSRDQFGPYTVPPGQYFAMGDNRDNSADSRVPVDAGGVGLFLRGAGGAKS